MSKNTNKSSSAVTPAVASTAKGALANYVKPPKTVLENGLTYSLCSRVLNAMHLDDQRKVQASSDTITMTDGRGTEKKVPQIVADLAGQLGAKFLASVKSSFLRPRMQIDLAKKTVTMQEIEKKAPVKKEEAAPALAEVKTA